jgi:hypothetical protein
MAHTVDKFTKIIADLRDSSRNVKNSGVAGYESTEKIDNGLVLFLLCDEQGNSPAPSRKPVAVSMPFTLIYIEKQRILWPSAAL